MGKGSRRPKIDFTRWFPVNEHVNLDPFLGAAESLRAWFEDESVTDILINGTVSVYVEKNGNLGEIPNPFSDGNSLFTLIERLLVPLGKRIDATQPYLDGHLRDGSRRTPACGDGGPL